MKKLILIVCLAFFSYNSISQVWIEPGAEWHYDYWTVGSVGFIKYEYVKDTLIEGHSCQKIIGESYEFCHNQYNEIVLCYHDFLPTQFTYVSGDTVFYRNNGEFFVLYNFGASIGDKWVIANTNPFGECDDTSRIEVVDTGRMTLNTVSYRFIKVQPTSNSPLGFKGTYVERFGNIDTTFFNFQYLFPGGFQCDSLTPLVEWNFFKFKCFKDTSFVLYNPSTEDCEYYLTHLGIEDVKSYNFSVNPNPFSTSTQISFDKTYQTLDLSLIDLQGKIIQQKSYHDCNKITLDRAGIANGFYFLRVNLDGKFVETKKVVVAD